MGWSEPAFEGDARTRIIVELQDHILQTGINGRPRFILLTGSSGTGKTRVMRELYRAMTETYSSPADAGGYWSPDPDGDAGRLLVRVSDRAQKATPHFFCIGIDLGRPSEGTQPPWDPEELLDDLRKKVRSRAFQRALGGDYPAVFWASTRIRERLRKDFAPSAEEDFLYEFAMFIFELIIPVLPVIAPLTRVYTTLKNTVLRPIADWIGRTRAFQVLRQKITGRSEGDLEARDDAREAEEEAQRRRRAVADARGLIVRISHSMPVLFLVNDLDAGTDVALTEVASLLGGLLKDASSLFVLATAATHRFLKQPEVIGLLRSRDAYYRAHLSLDDPRFRLNPAELKKIIAGALPSLSPENRARLVVKYDNNLSQLLERLRDERFVREAPTMTSTRLEELSSTEEEDLLHAWNGFGYPMQAALELSVLSSPAGIAEIFPNLQEIREGLLTDRSWDGDLTGQAAELAKDGKIRERSQDLRLLHSRTLTHPAMAWVRPSDSNGWEWWCSERTQFEFVLQRAVRGYRGDRHDYFEALAVAAGNSLDDRVRRRARARIMVALAAGRADGDVWSEEAVGAAEELIETAEREGRLRLAMAIADVIRDPSFDRGERRKDRVRRLLDALTSQPSSREWPATVERAEGAGAEEGDGIASGGGPESGEVSGSSSELDRTDDRSTRADSPVDVAAGEAVDYKPSGAPAEGRWPENEDVIGGEGDSR